jgi:5-methylcytosine-specific restriction endonuclease McrA
MVSSAARPAGLPTWAGRYAQRLTAETLAVKGTICHLCRRPGADTADHLIPRSKGGDDSLDNRAPAHHACNSLRGDLDLADWYARHPVARRPVLPPSRQW